MKMYIGLVNGFETSQNACAKCESIPEFKEFLDVRYTKSNSRHITYSPHHHYQQCKANSGIANDLNSLLIMPVQRMPRYMLLLKV